MAASVWMRWLRRFAPPRGDVGHDDAAVEAAHDARGDGARELTQRVAHGDGQLADADGGGVAQLGGRQAGGVDAHEREVGVGVDAGDLALEDAAVGEHHAHRVGILDDVMVGQDEPVGLDDDPRAGALLDEALGPVAVAGDLALVDGRRDVDGDDGRGDALDDADDDLVVAGRLAGALAAGRRLDLGGGRDTARDAHGQTRGEPDDGAQGAHEDGPTTARDAAVPLRAGDLGVPGRPPPARDRRCCMKDVPPEDRMDAANVPRLSIGL